MEREKFIQILNTLFGFKIKIKELRYRTKDITKHQLYDELGYQLSWFIDKFAEECFVVIGELQVNELEAIKFESNHTVEDLKNFIIKIKGKFSVSDEFAGLHLTLDEFITTVNNNLYLYKKTVVE